MKNKLLINKKAILIVAAFFVAVILLALNVYGLAYQSNTFSDTQYYQPSFQSYYSQQGINYEDFWPILANSKQCDARQDFIVNIRPGGCQPSVVRSDLLEEQNVPVFCKLDAVKLNPLIDVASIKSVRFKGEYPKEIAGVSFHPSLAALRIKGSRLESPIVNDVGYVVVNLKSMAEKEMPDSIKVNLTAVLSYDVTNAIGAGFTHAFVPVLTEEEWKRNYKEYGFWKGKGYIRVNWIEKDRASISIYSDADTKINTFVLDKGKTSDYVYIPGFYCMAGLQVRLVEASYPVIRAKLNINGDEIWVKEGSSVLDRCQVKKIEKFASGGSIILRCPEGDVRLDLGVAGKAMINKQEYETGEKVGVDNNKDIYLVYVGKGVFQEKHAKAEEKSFVILAKNPNSALVKEGKIDSESIIKLAEDIGKLIDDASIKNNDRKNRIEEQVKGKLGGDTEVEVVFKGEEGSFIKKFKFEAQGGIYDKNCDDVAKGDGDKLENCKKLEEYFQEARKTAENIISYYGSEKDEQGEYYGAKALYELADLAGKLGKQATQKEILQNLIKSFPDSKLIKDVESQLKGLEEYDYSDSTGNLVIGLNSYYVSLLKIEKPDVEDASAVFVVDSKEKIVLIDKYAIEPNNKNEYIKLIGLDDDKITVEYMHTVGKDLKTEKVELKKSDFLNVGDKRASLQEIKLKRIAEIDVIPKTPDVGTEANFTVAIGIEKRAIKLSTGKTKEMISNLNESIEKWEGVVNKLGNVVKGWKGVCFATSTTLVVKNFFQNLGGRSTARSIVMRKAGGWSEICKNNVSSGVYKNLDECYGKNSDKIDKAVDEVEQNIKDMNEKIKNSYVEKKGNIDSEETINNFADKHFIPFLIQNRNMQVKIYGKDTNLYGEKGAVFENEKAVKQAINDSKLSLDDMKEIMLYSNLKDDSNKIMSKSNLEAVIKPVYDSVKTSALVADYGEVVSNLGKDARITEIENYGRNVYSHVFYLDEGKISGVPKGDYVILAVPEGSKELSKLDTGLQKKVQGKLVLIPVAALGGGNYKVDREAIDKNERKAYTLTKNGTTLLTDGSALTTTDLNPVMNSLNIGKLVKIDRGMCQNKYTNPEVRFFDREPNKGMAALVPIDIQNGWYVGVKQVLPGLGIQAYSESGAVSSFWLCNVGKNGREDFENGINDDIPCTMINVNTGQSLRELPCLEPAEAGRLVTKAIALVQEASSQYGKKFISLRGVGSFPAKSAGMAEGTQCQDYMSPEDCAILFNTCDPVLCPSSRCDFGGTFRVDDVVQSGIIGSIALCLPNFNINPMNGVLVPVCLTGIHAGLDSWVSILKAHRDCLQESLDTGKYVGICDEIYSIYVCEFFWRQAAPLMDVAIPKLIEYAYTGSFTGSKIRGGGEYMTVQNAWDNMQKSVTYFTDYYGVNAFKAFQAKSTGEVGSEVCKAFVSTRYPNNKDLLDNLLEPESPVQFSAWFDEISYTTATVPASSQYKVFYHIYSGKDTGHYYQVYLKNPPETAYYSQQATIAVDSGYVGIGQSIDETKDFTAPSGYKELCVRIDAKDECGFKQVSTSFALDYMQDKYVQEQASEQVTTEKECVSGSPSLYPLLQPNIQAGVEEATLERALYNKGVIRICSTSNPGEKTNPGKWKAVGTCGDKKIICWLDTNSVKDVVKDLGIENKTLKEVDENSKSLIREIGGKGIGIMTPEQTASEIGNADTRIKETKTELGNKNINDILKISDKGFASSELGKIINNLNEIEKSAYGNNEKAKTAYMKFGVLKSVSEKIADALGMMGIMGKAGGDLSSGGSGGGKSMSTPKEGTEITEKIKSKTYKITDIKFKTKDNNEIGTIAYLNEKVKLEINHDCDSVKFELKKQIDFWFDESMKNVDYTTEKVILDENAEPRKYYVIAYCYDSSGFLKKTAKSKIIELRTTPPETSTA